MRRAMLWYEHATEGQTTRLRGVAGAARVHSSKLCVSSVVELLVQQPVLLLGNTVHMLCVLEQLVGP